MSNKSPETLYQKTTAAAAKSHSIITIDILRAVAALGVLCYHQHLGLLLSKYSHLHFLKAIDVFGASYAVPLFFLLSGYCIHLSNIKYVKANQSLPLKKYYLHRFLRIYPPYVIALFTAILINYVLNMEAFPTFNDLCIHIFALQGFVASSFNTINVVLWTISIELAFYFIYPVFYYLRLKYSLNLALLLTFIVSCISIAITIISTNGRYNFPQKYFVLNIWFAWCCGAFLADKKMLNSDDLRKPVYKIAYTFIVLCFWACYKFYDQRFDVIYYQFSILIWTAPLVLLISQEDWFKKHRNSTRLIAAIGLSSYSLYLLHEPFIYLKNFIAHQYFPAKYQLLVMCVGFVFIPVIAWFNYTLIEKPFMKLKRG